MTTLVITGIGELVTNASGVPGDLGIVERAAVAIDGGLVKWVGLQADLPDSHREAETMDVAGRAVLPGFVDAHTHAVFAGDRADEFTRRLEGASYEQILAEGGGIHSTVKATRAATADELVEGAAARLARMLRSGTTTVEVKSGYGLATKHEVRMLLAAVSAGEQAGVDVVPTFLGAHVPDRGTDPDEYTAQVIEQMLPAVAPLARFCDVFVDRGAFSVAQARSIFDAASAMGLEPRVHAEQLTHSGAAALAAEVGAASADHLDHATEDDARALAAAGVTAVLLPAASFSMRSAQAPGRMLWDAGVTVAIATDCNPGTSYVESMPLVVAFACLEMGLTPAEGVWAATAGGAASLRLDDRGKLAPGALADLVVLEAESHRHLPYRPGADLVARVVRNGSVVV